MSQSDSKDCVVLTVSEAKLVLQGLIVGTFSTKNAEKAKQFLEISKTVDKRITKAEGKE